MAWLWPPYVIRRWRWRRDMRELRRIAGVLERAEIQQFLNQKGNP